MSVQQRRSPPAAFLEAIQAVAEREDNRVRSNGYATARTGEVAAHVGYSRTTARRHLTRLKDGETLAEPYSGWWWLARYADHGQLLEDHAAPRTEGDRP